MKKDYRVRNVARLHGIGISTVQRIKNNSLTTTRNKYGN